MKRIHSKVVNAATTFILVISMLVPMYAEKAHADPNFQYMWPTSELAMDANASASISWVSSNAQYISMQTVDNPGATPVHWLINRQTNESQLLDSVTNDPQLSDNSQYILYEKETKPSTGGGAFLTLWLKDRLTGDEVQIDADPSNPDANSGLAVTAPGQTAISKDGSTAIFIASHFNAFPNVQSNSYNLYAYSRDTHQYELINDPFGKQVISAVVSGNGRYILYNVGQPFQPATIYLYDRATQNYQTVGTAFDCRGNSLRINNDGSFISYACASDSQVININTMEARSIGGGTTITSMSDDGRIIIFGGGVSYYIYSWLVNSTLPVDQGARSASPLISGDASKIAWNSERPANPPVSLDTTYAPKIGPSPAFVLADSTAPAIGPVIWSQNPKPTTATTTLTVPATDDSSGIQKAEYFIGDNDPGQGNGATMQLSNVQNGGLSADVTTTFGTDFPTGVYKISVRAQDTAGNWSNPVSDYLVVYDPAGPKMTGKRTIVPSLGNGDILPGLISNSQTDKAQFGFSVKYNNQGQINGNSDLQFSYSTGTHCNNPNNAVNCHALSLNATSISWLTTQGTNNSTGIFQGTATLNIDGQASAVLFRVTGVDGERLSATANDQFQIAIYNSGSNPNTDVPLYRVNSADITRGNIKIQ
jgi:hypothetical protein